MIRLTHIELANKAGHVVVLEVFRKHFFGEPALVKHMKAVAALYRQRKKCFRSYRSTYMKHVKVPDTDRKVI